MAGREISSVKGRLACAVCRDNDVLKPAPVFSQHRAGALAGAGGSSYWRMGARSRGPAPEATTPADDTGTRHSHGGRADRRGEWGAPADVRRTAVARGAVQGPSGIAAGGHRGAAGARLFAGARRAEPALPHAGAGAAALHRVWGRDRADRPAARTRAAAAAAGADARPAAVRQVVSPAAARSIRLVAHSNGSCGRGCSFCTGANSSAGLARC